jgi:four helix bundle protein
MDKPHKKLDVWKLSMDLAVDIYKNSDVLPREERYSLTDQARVSATSIPSNIAEGAARQTTREFIQFLHVAQGSLSELDTLIEPSRRFGFLTTTAWRSLDEIMERVDKMLSGLIRHQKSLPRGSARRRRSPHA